MKRLLVAIGLLFVGGSLFAAEPVTIQLSLDSRFADTNTSVAVSSFSVATIPAVDGYRQLKLQAGTSFFYVEDGTSSSATIRTSGLSVAADAVETIENNRLIGITLPVNVAATTVRYRERRKQ